MIRWIFLLALNLLQAILIFEGYVMFAAGLYTTYLLGLLLLGQLILYFGFYFLRSIWSR